MRNVVLVDTITCGVTRLVPRTASRAWESIGLICDPSDVTAMRRRFFRRLSVTVTNHGDSRIGSNAVTLQTALNPVRPSLLEDREL